MLLQWGSVCLEIHWPQSNLNLKFLQTLFNERHSGRDQCNRDSATAKHQMEYFIDIATTLTVLIWCLKQCGQQQPYVVLQQMYRILKAWNIQSRYRLKIFQKSIMSNTFVMTPRTNNMCGNLVRLDKAKSMKLKDTQLHLFVRKKWHFLMLENVLIAFTLKARMRLIFHAVIKLVF